MNLVPAKQPTFYFIGVTTTKSSIMKVFPAWAKELGLDAVIVGVDLPLGAPVEQYREVVQFIKDDPNSLGALVTTHKLNLFKASRDLFDYADEYATLLGEVSCISKRDGKLRGHAKDPISSGLSFDAIPYEGYWKDKGAEALLIGAGGSSLALSLYLHNKKLAGGDVPRKLHVTGTGSPRLDEMKQIHEQIGISIPVEYHRALSAEENDAVVSSLPEGSMVVNATGLGKDRPGSPLTDAVVFPNNGLVWEFNYRGDLVFLDQANGQKNTRSLTVVDGWIYFIHGWTRVIEEVFGLSIPESGLEFDRLSQVAIKRAQQ